MWPIARAFGVCYVFWRHFNLLLLRLDTLISLRESVNTTLAGGKTDIADSEIDVISLTESMSYESFQLVGEVDRLEAQVAHLRLQGEAKCRLTSSRWNLHSQ